MGRKQKYAIEDVISAIEKADGILTDASDLLGCSRQTLHAYVNRYAKVKDAYGQAVEKSLDVAEKSLMKQIRSGNVTAIIFFLKTKGKHRGYIERQEITGADGADLIKAIGFDINKV